MADHLRPGVFLNRAIATAATLLSASALACPVCGQVSEQGQGAYMVMTGIMTFLPLALIGGVITWVALRVRAANREEALELAQSVHTAHTAQRATQTQP